MMFNVPKLLFFALVDENYQFYVSRCRGQWVMILYAVPFVACVPLLLSAYSISELAGQKFAAVNASNVASPRSQQGNQNSMNEITKAHRFNSGILIGYLAFAYGPMAKLLRRGGDWTVVALCVCYGLIVVWLLLWCVLHKFSSRCVARMRAAEVSLWRGRLSGHIADGHQ